MIGDEIVAAARGDDIGAAAAIDGVVARAADQNVRSGGAEQADAFVRAQRAGVDVLEIGDARGIADRLVREREVDVGGRRENERIDAGSAVDGDFGPVINHGVVAAPGVNDVVAAPAVDGVVARPGRNDVGARRARDREGRGQRARVDVLEIGDGDIVARGLIGPRGRREIDRGRSARGEHDQSVDAGSAVDRELAAVIGHDIVAGARVDDIGAAASVEGVVARAAQDDIGAAGSRDRGALKGGEAGGVDVLEIDDIRDDAARLVEGVGEIDGRCDLEHERIIAGAAVDRDFRAPIVYEIVAAAGFDDIGAAAAVNRVVPRARRDRVGAGRAGDENTGGQDRGVQILEIDDGDIVARCLIDARRDREIHGHDTAGGGQDERVRARAAVDRCFGAVIGDDIVAPAGVDDIGAAAAVDGVGARAAGEDVGPGGSRQRDARRERGGVDILEMDDGDAVAEGLIRRVGEIDRDGRFQHERVHAGAAVDGDFAAVIRDDVVARARVDDVAAPAAVDGVVARARGDDIGRGGARDEQRVRQRARVDILEVGDIDVIAGGFVDAGRDGEIDAIDAAGGLED